MTLAPLRGAVVMRHSGTGCMPLGVLCAGPLRTASGSASASQLVACRAHVHSSLPACVSHLPGRAHAAVTTPAAAAGSRRAPRAARLMCAAAAAVSAAAGKLPECRLVMGESVITLETGGIARQANGAVLAREGETTILSTICTGDSGDGSFLPLTVVYQERFSAAGRTSSGFSKRDGRPRDSEVLVSRLVDRPLRPVFPDGFTQDTQILQLVLSWGGERTADALAITAAGAAAAVSDVPMSKPVAGVRVGWLRGASAPVVNPTVAQMENSVLDLVLGGTSDAILMIEGFCDFLTEEQMLVAVEAGHAAVRVACLAIADWAARVGKAKDVSTIVKAPEGLYEAVAASAQAEMDAALRNGIKQDRGQAQQAIDTRVTAELSEKFAVGDIRLALKKLTKNVMRTQLRVEKLRSDGRGPDDVRAISSEAGLLPRVHGCSLFTRGETQALAVVTLGGDSDAQRVDDLLGAETLRRFSLLYYFPPFSVGETGRFGAPSRRELGHGNLAERALLPILPSREAFPYTIRVESTITESNGSSSMASVCAGCLALQDAGVPVKRTVAGVAMGLVLPEQPGQEAIILTDILGSEDALGDMDFKVAGDADGITAFQMDIKVEGITLDILTQALAAARKGRLHILDRMAHTDPPPRKELASSAPRVGCLRIDPSKSGMVIGAGGKTIRGICETTGCTDIQIDEEGNVTITAPSQSALDAAVAVVRGMTTELTVGEVYMGCKVVTLTDFGAFVEVLPGKSGLLHISELDVKRVAAVTDVVKVGDLVDVKLLEIKNGGQLRLSRRAVLEAAAEPTAR